MVQLFRQVFFQGDVKDILLVDVIPLSLSIETAGGVATKSIVERNTAIPTSRSQTFSTYADNQTSVEIHVVQGERAMAADNKSPRQVPARWNSTSSSWTSANRSYFRPRHKRYSNCEGKREDNRQRTVYPHRGLNWSLNSADIDKMKQDAEMHAAEDAKRKEVVEVKNLAEQMIYTAEKAVKDNGDKVDAAVVTEVNEKIAALKTCSRRRQHRCNKVCERSAFFIDVKDWRSNDGSSDQNTDAGGTPSESPTRVRPEATGSRLYRRGIYRKVIGHAKTLCE